MTEPTQPSEPMSPEPPAPEPTPPPAPAAPAGWAAPAAPMPAPAMTGPRPQGLTIAAILAGIYGGLLILVSLFLILGMSILGGAAGAANGSGALGGAIAGIGFVAAIFVILIALAYIATAVGNWRGRRWSWTLGMVVWIVTLVFGVLGLSGGVNIFNLVLQIVFPIVAIYFLWQPDVKRALGRS